MFDFHMHIYKNEKPQTKFLNIAVDLETSHLTLKSKYSAIGIYPLHKGNPKDLEPLAKKANAIGEIGLDYSQGLHPPDNFTAQLNLAEKHSLPVIIHSRKAESDCLKILKNYPSLTVVLHSFGTPELIPEALSRNYFFSYSFFYSSRFKKMARQIPLSKTILETDYPYKAKTLDEAHNLLEKTAEKLSPLLKTSKEKILETTEKNALSLLE